MRIELSTRVRRAVLFGAPLGYIVLGLVHPMDDLEVGDAAGFYIVLHLVQPILIGLMACALWLLVDGLESRAATVVRYALIPYVITYAVFDAVAGIAIGAVVHQANKLSAADQAAVQRMFDGPDNDLLFYALYIGAGLAWLIPAVAAAIAIRHLVPGWITAAMVIGAIIFAVGHPFPPGPIGMTLYLVGILWFELRAREQPASEAAAPVPG